MLRAVRFLRAVPNCCATCHSVDRGAASSAAAAAAALSLTCDMCYHTRLCSELCRAETSRGNFSSRVQVPFVTLPEQFSCLLPSSASSSSSVDLTGTQCRFTDIAFPRVPAVRDRNQPSSRFDDDVPAIDFRNRSRTRVAYDICDDDDARPPSAAPAANPDDIIVDGDRAGTKVGELVKDPDLNDDFYGRDEQAERRCEEERVARIVAAASATPLPFRAYAGGDAEHLPLVSYPSYAPLRFVHSEADATEMLIAARLPPRGVSARAGISVVGIDTETQPSFHRPSNQRKGRFPPSLVQIATRTACFLVLPARLREGEPASRLPAATRALIQILEDPMILKVGLALDGDLHHLQLLREQPASRNYENDGGAVDDGDDGIVADDRGDSFVARAQKKARRPPVVPFFTPRSIADLGEAARRAALVAGSGLGPLVAVVFGRKLSKVFQMSNWGAPRLGTRQLLYAATDAWICLHLFDVFVQERLFVRRGAELSCVRRPLLTFRPGTSKAAECVGEEQPPLLLPLWDETKKQMARALADAEEKLFMSRGREQQQQQQRQQQQQQVQRPQTKMQASSARPLVVIVENFSLEDCAAVFGALSFGDFVRFIVSCGAVRRVISGELRPKAVPVAKQDAELALGQPSPLLAPFQHGEASAPLSVLLVSTTREDLAVHVATLLNNFRALLRLPAHVAAPRIISPFECSSIVESDCFFMREQQAVLTNACTVKNGRGITALPLIPRKPQREWRSWVAEPTRFVSSLRMCFPPELMEPGKEAALVALVSDGFAKFGFPRAVAADGVGADVDSVVQVHVLPGIDEGVGRVGAPAEGNAETTAPSPSVPRVRVVVEMSSAVAAVRAIARMNFVVSFHPAAPHKTAWLFFSTLTDAQTTRP